VHGTPIAFARSWVWVGSTRDFGNTDNDVFETAMIEEHFVAPSHPAQIVSRSVISNARPIGLALGRKVRPRVRGRFLFHQPEIFHDSNRYPLRARPTTARAWFTIELMRRSPFSMFE